MNSLLQETANYLKEQLKAKLVAQDHVATKKLLNSIDVTVQETVSGWKLVGTNLFYGNVQDTGLRPGVYVPIKALIDWIRAKKINLFGRRELDMAYAIRTNIYKRGTPTDGNPEKKRWISSTLEEETPAIKQMVQKALKIEIELMVKNMIENTQKTF
jgi:hypothetical protein